MKYEIEELAKGFALFEPLYEASSDLNYLFAPRIPAQIRIVSRRNASPASVKL